MIRGVGRVIIFAKEMAPMISFYRDVLSAKGIRFVNEDLWSDSSVRFDILDPEGNVVQISKE